MTKRREPDLIALLAKILVDTPKIPEAACIAWPGLHDPAGDGEPIAAVIDRHATAADVCADCPVLAACKTWADTEGPYAGVVAGRVPPQRRSGGISERTLQRARKKLGVIIGYTDKGTSTWSLPSQGSVVDGEVVTTPVPPATDNLSSGTSPKSGTSPGHRPVPTPVPQEPTRAYANPNGQAQGGTSPRSTTCKQCFITLPTTVADDLCEDCAEGHSFLQNPPTTAADKAPAVPVHSATIEKRESRVGHWIGSGRPVQNLRITGGAA